MFVLARKKMQKDIWLVKVGDIALIYRKERKKEENYK